MALFLLPQFWVYTKWFVVPFLVQLTVYVDVDYRLESHLYLAVTLTMMPQGHDVTSAMAICSLVSYVHAHPEQHLNYVETATH